MRPEERLRPARNAETMLFRGGWLVCRFLPRLLTGLVLSAVADSGGDIGRRTENSIKGIVRDPSELLTYIPRQYEKSPCGRGQGARGTDHHDDDVERQNPRVMMVMGKTTTAENEIWPVDRSSG